MSKTITFGRGSVASNYSEWILERTTDLVSYTRIFRFVAPENGDIIEFADGVTGDITNDDFTIQDSEGATRFFYRLRTDVFDVANVDQSCANPL